MRMLRIFLVAGVAAGSLSACNPDVPTSVAAPADVRFDNGGGFGSGTRRDTTTANRGGGNANNATPDSAGGVVSVSADGDETGGGFGSGT